MAFHVGQKVVCVDDIPMRGCQPFDAPLRAGQIYTIARVAVIQSPLPRNGQLGFDIAELPRPCGILFWYARFRPVIERKTDIAIFTAMLTPNKVNA